MYTLLLGMPQLWWRKAEGRFRSQGLSVWDFWWTNCHCARFLFQCFCVPLSVSFHQRSVLSHSSVTDGTECWQRCLITRQRRPVNTHPVFIVPVIFFAICVMFFQMLLFLHVPVWSLAWICYLMRATCPACLILLHLMILMTVTHH
jgi:hypothetical protein